MSFLKPKYQTNPTNVNQKLVTDLFSPQAQAGGTGMNFLTSLLTGTGDVGAAQGGYDAFKEMTGYQPAMDAMTRSVTGTAAARGLLRSGSTSKALAKYGTELDQQYAGNYLQNLAGLSELGQGAGQLLVGAGSGESKERPRTAGMIASGLGKVLSLGGLFSDRRLKTDIEKVGEFPDGLGIYHFRYIDSPELYRGTMADEVAKLRPWALGEPVDGFQTVVYERL